jgi:hypothetical protein
MDRCLGRRVERFGDGRIDDVAPAGVDERSADRRNDARARHGSCDAAIASNTDPAHDQARRVRTAGRHVEARGIGAARRADVEARGIGAIRRVDIEARGVGAIRVVQQIDIVRCSVERTGG